MRTTDHFEAPSPRGREDADPTPGKRDIQVDLTVAVLLVASILVVYAPSLSGGFLDWDDRNFIHENPELDLPVPQAAGRIFTTTWFYSYNPVHRLLNLALWKGFGDSPLPFRLTNLALHLAACWLVFLVLREWIGRTAPAAAAAILFAVHPSNVENVAWIAEARMLLSATFGFGALLAWLRFRKGWRPGYALALALYTTALASKTGIIVLPALLFLLDWSRGPRPALRAYLPFAVPAIFFGVMQVWAAAQPLEIPTEDAIAGLHGGSIGTHAATVATVLSRYALGALSPIGQACMHRFEPVTAIGDPRLWVAMLALAATAVLVRHSWRRGSRRFAIAASWFVVSLMPVLVVPIPILYAERFLYLALPFLLVLLTEPLLRQGPPAQALRHATTGVGIAVFAVFGLLYARTWKDDASIWEQAVKVDERAPRCWLAYGHALDAEGDPRAALGAFRRAAELAPDSSTSRQALGLAEANYGSLAKGLALLRELADHEEGGGKLWANLAMVEDRAEDERTAALTFRRGLNLHPEDPYLWKNLGKFHLNHGRLPMGAQALENAARHDPEDAEAWTLLADVYRRAGLPEEARRCEEALAELGSPR